MEWKCSLAGRHPVHGKTKLFRANMRSEPLALIDEPIVVIIRFPVQFIYVNDVLSTGMSRSMLKS